MEVSKVSVINSFSCDRCGLCCRHIKNIELLKELDDGTGTCRFLNRETNLCSIYNSRPLICNVDDAYEIFFKENMTREEYYMLNYSACKKFKEQGCGERSGQKFIQ